MNKSGRVVRKTLNTLWRASLSFGCPPGLVCIDNIYLFGKILNIYNRQTICTFSTLDSAITSGSFGLATGPLLYHRFPFPDPIVRTYINRISKNTIEVKYLKPKQCPARNPKLYNKQTVFLPQNHWWAIAHPRMPKATAGKHLHDDIPVKSQPLMMMSQTDER